MSADKKKPLLDFPCHFDIKVVGKNCTEFSRVVNQIFITHTDSFNKENIKKRLSKNSNYCALTISIFAQSKKQLDTIYSALNRHETVLYTL